MSKCRKLIKAYYAYFALGGAFLLLVFWNALYLENWLDSDMAAEMMFSKLLMQEGKWFATTSWYYSTEFRFLYTHLIMGPLFRICQNWHIVRMITNVIFYLLLLLSYLYMMATLPIEKKKKILGGAILLLPFSETMMLHMHMGNTYMSHVIILFCDVGLFLRLTGAQRKQKEMWALWICYIALSIICGVSGIRYMLALQCPLVIASIWYLAGNKAFRALRREISKERLRAVFCAERLRFLVVSVIGAFCCMLGYGINVFYVSRTYRFQTYESTNFIDVYQGVLLERLQNAFGALLMLFGYIPGKSVLSFRGLISMTAFLLLILLGCVAWKERRERHAQKRFLVLLFYSGFLLNSFVFVFTNSTLVPRYYITSVILLIPLALFYLEEEKRPLNKYMTAFLLLLCLFLATAKTGASMMKTDKNKERKAVAQRLVETGYVFGYATYWNANITQELSNGKVEVANLHREDDGGFSLFRWSSMQRYYEQDYPKGEVFLLLTTEEEDALQETKLLQEGREDFRENGYVVYCYENNEAFLKAAQEVFL